VSYKKRNVESTYSDTTKFTGVIGLIAYGLLFPGYFFYNSLVGLEVIPQFLAGYFGLVSLVVLVPLLGANLQLVSKKLWGRTALDKLFFAILFWTTLVSGWQYVNGSTLDQTGIFTWSLAGVLFNYVVYMIARCVPIYDRKFYVLNVITVLIMAVVVIVYSSDGIFYLRLVSDIEGLANYQGFARSILVTAIFTVVFIESKKYKFGLFCIGVAILFLNGARSEFVFFVFSFAAVIATVWIESPLKMGLALATILALSIAAYVFASGIVSLLPDTRMLQLFDIFESSSFALRNSYTADAVQTISENPVFGDYGSYVSKHLSIGSYSHNLLSAWVNLGSVGFFLYVAVLYRLLVDSFVAVRRDSKDKLALVCLVYSFIILGAYLMSKDYSYMLTGLAVGLVSRLKYRNLAR